MSNKQQVVMKEEKKTLLVLNLVKVHLETKVHKAKQSKLSLQLISVIYCDHDSNTILLIKKRKK